MSCLLRFKADTLFLCAGLAFLQKLKVEADSPAAKVSDAQAQKTHEGGERPEKPELHKAMPSSLDLEAALKKQYELQQMLSEQLEVIHLRRPFAVECAVECA